MTQTPKVGDILDSSWGYDQTNIDFYQVVKTTEHSVWLRSIGAEFDESTERRLLVPVKDAFTDLTRPEIAKDDDGNDVTIPCEGRYPCSGYVGPDSTPDFCYFGHQGNEHPVEIMVPNPPKRKKWHASRGSYWINLTSYSGASPWDGTPRYDTIAAGDPGH